MNDSNPVRLAVVGVGLIGSKHANLVNVQRNCSLVGICDLNSDQKEIAEELQVPFYSNLEKMLECEQPEGVIIATPNGSHAHLAEVCAKHLVPILIEKPIADSIESAEKISKLKGIQVLVGHHRRHNPLIQKTRHIVQSGVLGQLVAISMMWTLLKPADYFQVDWRCHLPDGGPTLINLIHELDVLRFVCGEIRQVYAQSALSIRNLEVEDSLAITLSFNSGAVGSVLASDATSSPWSYEMNTGENPYYFHIGENCYHFLGTLGSFSFPRMELWRYPNQREKGWQHPLEKSIQKVVREDPLKKQLEHFCRVIRDEELPLVDSQDGKRSLAVALAVLKSIKKGEPILLA